MTTPTMTFLGAAGSVTGSKYLIRVGERRILVDAGLFQGEKELRRRNWADFPVPPDTLTDVLLTHAHMDHCGYLPALVKAGFDGPVWCTRHTVELAEIVLRDAGYLQERDALDAAEGGWSKHEVPRPLYDSNDVEATLPLLTAVEYDAELDLGDGISASWTRAGHILGSASVRLTVPGEGGAPCTLLFSGDLGRRDHPVLRARETPPGAAIVVCESTYGDRDHPRARNLPHEGLADAIRRTIGRGGSVLIPAFAVDRTEVVLSTLAEMRRHGRIPRTPVYVNSPMAAAALGVYRRATEELRADVDFGELLADLHEVRSAEDSRALTLGGHAPSIIISSSGMATGGRVLHHLERMLPDPRNAVVLTGYQAIGTRGRSLAEGATRVKMHGRYVGVRAEIVKDEEFSVHADAAELVDWVRALDPAPGIVYCTHGEPEASATLAGRLERELGVVAVAPALDEVVTLVAPERPAYAVPAPADAPSPAPAGGTSGADRLGGLEAWVPQAPTPAVRAAPVVAAAGSGVTLDGIPIEGASVRADLTARRDTDGAVLLDGTITIRLTPPAD